MNFKLRTGCADYPLVSVIMPAFNHGRFVQKAIRSVIEQTYRRIEFIVLDDGSTDDTALRIDELAPACLSRFDRFAFIKQPNKGLCATLNALLSNARGKYVYLIASDDKAAADAVQCEVDFLETNPDYGLVVGDSVFIDENDKEFLADKYLKRADRSESLSFRTFSKALEDIHKPFLHFGKGDINRYFLFFGLGNFVPNGYLIRKDAYDKVGQFTEEAPLEDLYLMMQLSKFTKMKFINRPLFYYRRHDNCTTSPDNWNTLGEIRLEKNLQYERKLLRDKNSIFGNLLWLLLYGTRKTVRQTLRILRRTTLNHIHHP